MDKRFTTRHDRSPASPPRGGPEMGDAESAAIAERAAALAESLLRHALAAVRPDERQRAHQVAGLIGDPAAKSLSMAMTDRLIRSSDAERSARAWRSLLERYGLPRGFSGADRFLMRAGAGAARVFPELVMKALRRRLRKDSSGVILPADDASLTRHLADRRAEGMRTNVNHLGEAVLGEGEAQRRLEAVRSLLARPDVDYVSVKLSAIYSQIHVAAWESSLATVMERLRVIYRTALPARKMVSLDMEEYRDLALTTAAFRGVLDEPEFHDARAGIVLQAYLPDSFPVLQDLTAWAQRRVASGGFPIKVRLVKGANLAMESVEAELHGWNPAPYSVKRDTDASFRRMMDYACRPEHTPAVRVGIGSHNLFDVALALVLRETRNLGDAVEIEMLEGMAPHQARSVRDAAGGLLLYAPVVHEKDFGAALAYLIRRLDENTSPENFLSGLFSFVPDSPAWLDQRRRFLDGWNHRHAVSTASRRALPAPRPLTGFYNEPDTDFTQEQNRRALTVAPAPDFGPVPAACDLAGVSAALDRAVAGRRGWAQFGDARRAAILRRCAEVMTEHRFEIIALLRDEGKKAVLDADSEVSEAVDFARYYAETGSAPDHAEAGPLGTVVVTPPWNFPFAIPCGGAAAALMAGNTVILKPAPETVRLGWLLANLLWQGGVPREALHFLTCDDGETGRALITDERSSAVILTGAWETAAMFLRWRPSLKLFAETSGKNSIIVSDLADRDLAVKDLVRSAFGHAGQKCSAASLGILEAGVYDDPVFRRQLRDAAASMHAGPADDAASIVTPLIRPAGEALLRALTTLDAGEEWLLEPRRIGGDPCLWTPGIRLGVKPGSWFHQTECFGPVLGLMRARHLDEAAELQNGTPYGLTAGFHSLDEDEVAAWRDRVVAGNLYINRAITGAIVQRQPFGGWKRSSIGPGSKAGGPNYVNLFRRFAKAAPLDAEIAARNYREAWESHFSISHDPSALRCESNEFRYRPCRGVILRIAGANDAVESAARAAAAICAVPLTISRGTEESDAALAARLPQLAAAAEFLRTVAVPSDALLRAAHAIGLSWIDAPLSDDGRLELTRWLREQSVSETRHRYGNVRSSGLAGEVHSPAERS